MSMTENEAINEIMGMAIYRLEFNTPKDKQCLMFKVLEKAIQALEEIQQYRAIGTIEEFKALKENERKCEDCAGCTSWLCECANERGEAIDEFAEALKKEISFRYGSGQINRAYNAKEKTLKLIDELAEQMKAGSSQEV